MVLLMALHLLKDMFKIYLFLSPRITIRICITNAAKLTNIRDLLKKPFFVTLCTSEYSLKILNISLQPNAI